MTNRTTRTTVRRSPMRPGRRLTLVIGASALLAVIGCAAVDALTTSSFPVSYTFPPGNGQLTARFENGTITLRQAAVSTPVLNGTGYYSGSRSTFSHSGATVQYHCPGSLGCRIDATIRVPANAPVSLSANGSDVNLPSFSRQEITLNTGGGDLTAGTVSGNLNLDTSGGDLTAATVSGNLNLDTSGGDVNIAKLTGPPAKVVSGGGDITVKAMSTSGTTTVDSHGGDVTLTATKAPENLQVTSASGGVTLVLPRGSYDFNVNTGGGDLSEPTSDPQAANKITVQSGGGDVTISEAS